MNSQGPHRLKVTALGKRGKEEIENHPSMLPGLGSDKRSQAEPSPLLLETLILALCPQPCAQTLTAGLACAVGCGGQAGAWRGMRQLSKKRKKKEKKNG